MQLIITTSDSVYQYRTSQNLLIKLLHLEEHTQLVTFDRNKSCLLTCVEKLNCSCSFHQMDQIPHPVEMNGNFIPPDSESNVTMIAESTHSIILASNFHNDPSVITTVSLVSFEIIDSDYLAQEEVKLVDGFVYGENVYFLGVEASKRKSVLVEKSLAIRQTGTLPQITISCSKSNEAKFLYLQGDILYMIFSTANQNKSILCNSAIQKIVQCFHNKQGLVAENLLETEKRITAVTTINGLVLIGTSDGSLITLNPSSTGRKTINIGEQKILPGIVALKSMKSLLIPTEMSLIKLPIETCEHYKNVNACHQSKDPLCGWCLMSSTCTDSWACKNQKAWLLEPPFRHDLCSNFKSCQSCLQTRSNPNPTFVCHWCANSRSCIDHQKTHCNNYIGSIYNHIIETPVSLGCIEDQELVPAGSNICPKLTVFGVMAQTLVILLIIF